MAATVSVIIPAYNSAAFVEETIASVAAQQRPPDELIVVDDGSTDCTAEVVERALARTSIPAQLIRQENGGVAVARNRGALASHGDLVTFLDADDLLLPEHLAAVEKLLDHHPGAVVGFADVREFDEDGEVPRSTRERSLHRRSGIHTAPAALPGATLLGDGLTAAFLLGNFISNSSAVIRRTALSRIGLFDPAFRIGEDRDLYLRLSLLGPFVELPQVTGLRRRHANSIMATRNNLQWAATSLRLLAAFRDRHPELVTSGALRDAFVHASSSWAQIALHEAASTGTGELRRMVRHCRSLGFGDRPTPRGWARAIRASLWPTGPTRTGAEMRTPLPRTQGR